MTKMNTMKKNLILVGFVMMLVAACGKTTSVEEDVKEEAVVKEHSDVQTDEEINRGGGRPASVEEREKEEIEEVTQELEEEEALAEEPAVEEVEFDLKNVSTWDEKGTVNIGYSSIETGFTCCLAFWADYHVTDTGTLEFTNLKDGFYFEAPVDITHVLSNAVIGETVEGVTFDYFGLLEGDQRFMILYSTVPGVFASDEWYKPFEGYECVENEEFEVWFNDEISREEALKILESCEACRSGDALSDKYYELEGRYNPQ